jgi:hypothetical protein
MGEGVVMATSEPAQPAGGPAPGRVRASTLAAWQLVEDARYRVAGRPPHLARRRLLAQRAVADRRAERELPDG